MPKKKKKEIDVSVLDPRATLEETVVCSMLGRTIASFGAILTGREKRYAPLVYNLLQTRSEEFSSRWPVVAKISREIKSKKPSPTEAIDWFSKKYPEKAGQLLAFREKKYNETEISVQYGLRQGRDLPDDYWVRKIEEVLEIPEHEATILYHGILKPVLRRIDEEKGLTSFNIKS
jgi:hypothetical protein